MPNYGSRSKAQLSTCTPNLQRVFNEVIKHWDCIIITGHRNKEDQNAAFASKLSQLPWPKGEHNSLPSRAVDVAPYPIDWTNTRRFDVFAGFVLGIAKSMGIKLRWGGDWNRNKDPRDERFIDLVHFEEDD